MRISDWSSDVCSSDLAARHLLPLLAEHGHGGYVLIGGPGAEHPWAGYGHYSIGAAALRMLARVLHDEARTLPVRVQLLAIDSPARTDANARPACNKIGRASCREKVCQHVENSV